MTEHRTLSEILADLQRSQQALLDMSERIDDATLYQRSTEQEWTMAENLVHIAEARQFFASEVQKALLTSGARVGRTITDHARVQNVLEHGYDSCDVITQKLVASYELVLQTLKPMHDDDLQKMVEHSKYGPQTLGAFIEHFIVEHDQAHVQQVRKLLS